MNRKTSLTIIAIIWGSLQGNVGVQAATIYQWTDDFGTVHFSDTPPAAASQTVSREIEFDEFNHRDISEELISLNELSDTLADQRQQLASERMERKRLYLEEKRLDREIESARLDKLMEDHYYYRPYTTILAFPRQRYNGYGYGATRQRQRPHRERDHQAGGVRADFIAGNNFKAGINFSSGRVKDRFILIK